MKISSDSISKLDIPDYNALFLKFCQEYRNVFMFHSDDQFFIYRALGRGEYKEILKNPILTDLDREEVICDTCVLYPERFDWENCEAGLPTVMSTEILKKSYLTNLDERANLHTFYRSEMYDLDNQITCIIHEAFPQYELEDIDKWDVEKTTKYLSRAEWILENLRKAHVSQVMQGEFSYGNSVASDMDEGQGDTYGDAYAEKEIESSETQEAYDQTELDRKLQEFRQRRKQNSENQKTLRGGSRADKLTPDNMRSKANKQREWAEFLRTHPDFARLAASEAGGGVADLTDSIMAGGISGLSAQASVDSTPAALRTAPEEKVIDAKALDDKIAAFRAKHNRA